MVRGTIQIPYCEINTSSIETLKATALFVWTRR
jgi:hypothetical protein